MICECCHGEAPYLYLISVGTHAGKCGCFDCVPEVQKDSYPGWREAEALKEKRASQARENLLGTKS